MNNKSTPLWMSLAITLFVSCKEITPLTPSKPITGQWILDSWQSYKLPAWYVTKTNDSYLLTDTDTVFTGPPAQLFDVYTLTLNPDGSCSESYLLNPGLVEPKPISNQVDQGHWTLTDSVVTLSVANAYPHQLTYRISTDQLITDIVPKVTVIRLSDDSVYTVKYSRRIYYRRVP